MKKRINIALILICALFNEYSLKENIRVIERFSPESQIDKEIRGWKGQIFSGQTQYSIIEEDDNHVLHAYSRSAASGLIKEIEYLPSEYPCLSWRWKVNRIPPKGDAGKKETDDYGARVYVIFPHFLKWRTKTINYIWANKLQKNKIVPNSWLPKNAFMIAVRNNGDSTGVWFTEKRNVYEDYRKIFGKEPPRIGAIAVMSDADNTGGVAEAFYDDFVISGE